MVGMYLLINLLYDTGVLTGILYVEVHLPVIRGTPRLMVTQLVFVLKLQNILLLKDGAANEYFYHSIKSFLDFKQPEVK